MPKMCSEVKIDVNNFVFCIRFLNLFFLDFNINFNKTFWVYMVICFLLSTEEFKRCWRFPLSVNFSTVWYLCHILKLINLDGHFYKNGIESLFKLSYITFVPLLIFSSYSGYSLRKSKAYCIKKWACLKATATWGTETPTLPHFLVLKIKLNPRLSLTFLLWKHSN